MTLRAPMRLLYNKAFFGTLVTYGYETPWATGRLVAQDQNQHHRCMKVCSFLQWVEHLPDDLTDEGADTQYDHALAKYGLTENDISWYDSGEWTVVTSDGEERPIYSPFFFDDGFLQWRW